MKILLDIKEGKAAFLLELLKNLNFVNKATPITNEKAALMEEFKEAIDELNLAKSGKLEATNAEDLINDL